VIGVTLGGPVTRGVPSEILFGNAHHTCQISVSLTHTHTHTRTHAHTRQVCGTADVDGDFIVPVPCAHLDGALNVNLEGAFHSPLGSK
jgi:hypothetical protein